MRGSLRVSGLMSLVLALLLMTGTPLHADGVPQFINVQGALFDNDDNPVNGTYDITIVLYDAAEDGTALITKLFKDAVVSDGVFHVTMPITGNPFKSVNGVWLGIKVQDDLEMSPRQQITAAPYAFQALHADEAAVAKDLSCTKPSGCVDDAELVETYAYGDGNHNAINALSLTCDGCVTSGLIGNGEVKAADVDFTYALSTVKGGAASNLDCQGGPCVSGDEVSFLYAGSASKGGPASDVACTGCISDSELELGYAFGDDQHRATDLECTTPGCVGSADIGNGAVALEDLAGDSVNSSKIVDKSIEPKDLSFSVWAADADLTIEDGKRLIFLDTDSDGAYFTELSAENKDDYNLGLVLTDDADGSEVFTVNSKKADGTSAELYSIGSDGVAYYSNKLGIGTDSPDTSLHILGSGMTVTGNNKDTLYGYQGIETTAGDFGLTGSALQVGIGTAAPKANLHVLGADAGTDPASSGVEVVISNTDPKQGNYAAFAFDGSAGGGSWGRIGMTFINRTATMEVTDLFFMTLGDGALTEKFRITGAGDVGVGTQAPGTLYNVNQGSWPSYDDGDTVFTVADVAQTPVMELVGSPATDLDKYGALYFTHAAGQSDAHRQVAGIWAEKATYSSQNSLSGGRLVFMTKVKGSGTQHKIVMDEYGRLGVGVTAPGHKLDVNGAINGTQLCIGADCKGAWPLSVADWWTLVGNELYPKSTSYNVSVGKTTGAASAKLDVNGKLRVSGGYMLVLDSQASGSEDWALQSDSEDFVIKEPEDGGKVHFKIHKAGSIELSPNGSTAVTINTLGQMGVGVSTPKATLHVGGPAIIPSLRGNLTFDGDDWYAVDSGYGQAITFNATDGKIYFATTAASMDAGDVASVANRMVIDKNGFVGIGTSAPTYKLQVAATGNKPGLHVSAADVSPFNAKIASFEYGANGNFIHIEQSGGKPVLQARLGNGSIMDLLLNPSGGNVGVGTIAPGSALTVADSGDNVLISLHRKNANLSTDFAGLGFSMRQDGQDSTSDTRAGIFYQYNGNVFIAAKSGVTDLPQKPLDYSRLFINGNTGNVGIGTTAPSKPLTVQGDIYTSADAVVNNAVYAGSVCFGDEASTDCATSWSSVASHWHLEPSANELYPKETAYNVGIGMTAPVEKLEVNGNIKVSNNKFLTAARTTGGTYKIAGITAGNVVALGDIDNTDAMTYVNAGNDLELKTNNVGRIIVKKDGKVGVGIASPTHAMQVNGSISLNTKAGAENALLRVGGVYFSWDAAYGTSGAHALRSTYGVTYADSVTLNSYNHVRINLDSNSNDGTSYFEVGHHTADTANTMLRLVSPSGNLGLNTGDPKQKLHIGGTGGVPAIQLGSDSTGRNFVITGNTGGPSLLFGLDNGTTMMTVRSNGRVGIGTTSPSGILHIDKDMAGIPKLFIDDPQSNGADDLIKAQSNSGGADTVQFKVASDGDVYANKDILANGVLGTNKGIVSHVDGHHVTHMQWYGATGEGFTGYVKLITPIEHKESNMFSIKIKGYGYSTGSDAIEIRCGGYAYNSTSGGLISTDCHTTGTDIAVEIATEVRAEQGGKTVVVIRLGTPSSSWYYPHFTAEYSGWQPKVPQDFKWTHGEKTPLPGMNYNNVVVNDGAGTIKATGNITTPGKVVAGQICWDNDGNCFDGKPGDISGSGSTGKLAKFTGGKSIGDSAVYESGGKVGIGTVSPRGALDLNGALYFGGGSSPSNIPTNMGVHSSDAALLIATNTSSVTDLRLYLEDDYNDMFSIWGGSCTGGGCNDLSKSSKAHSFTGGGDAYHKGNLGVGVAPGAKLHVAGNTLISNSGDLMIQEGAITGTQGEINLYMDNDQATLRIDANSGVDDSSGKLFIRAGQVDIGGTTPDGKLGVQSTGDAVHLYKSVNADRSWIKWSQGSQAHNWRLGQLGDPYSLGLYFGGAGATATSPGAGVMTWSTGGLVGIGTTAPTAKLEVKGGDILINRVADGGQATLQLNASGTTGSFRAGRIDFMQGGLHTTKWSLIKDYSQTGTTTFDFEYGGSRKMTLVGSNGYVGIGTSTPSKQLDVSGYVKATGYCIGSVCQTSLAGGTGTTNYVSKWTSANGQGNSQLFDNGTNVGVGTPSPTSKLHVAGSVYTSGDLIVRHSNGANNKEFIGFKSGGGAVVHHDAAVAVDTSSISSFAGARGTSIVTINNAGSGPALTIPNGKVGIGTTTPAYELEVENATGSAEILVDGKGSGLGGVYIRGAVRAEIELYDAGAGADQKRKMIWSDDGKLIFGKTNDAWTAGTNQMVIDNNGKVGIGTSTPEALVHVNGSSTTYVNQLIQNTNTTAGPYGAAGISLKANGSDGFIYAWPSNSTTANRAGRLIVGTGSGNAAGVLLKTTGNHPIELTAYEDGSSAPDLVVKPDGKIGVGTASPAEMIHIAKSSASGYVGIRNENSGNSNLEIRSYGDSSAAWPSAGIITTWNTDVDLGLVADTKTLVDNGTSSHYLWLKANSGNVGIGTKAPAKRLEVAGGVKATEFCIGGECKNSWASVNNIWQKNGTKIYYNTNNVGIGTTDPGRKLHVAGEAFFTGPVGIGWNTNWHQNLNIRKGLSLQKNNGDGTVLQMYVDDTTQDTIFKQYKTGWKETVRFAADGKVKIGAGTPSDYLHVAGDWFDTSTDNWGGGIKMQGNNPTISFWETDNGAHRWMWHLSSDTMNLYRRPAGGSWQRFVTVNSSGNMGINISSASEKLHVSGTIRSDGATGFSYQGIVTSGNGVVNKAIVAQDYSQWIWNTATSWGLFWGGTSGAAYTAWGGSDPNEIIFVGAGNTRASINLNNGDSYFQGSMGIGTSSLQAKLNVQSSTASGADNTARFYAPAIGANASHIHHGTTGDWYIRSASSSGKVILQDSGGNVGVGTSVPGAKLEVAGTFRTTNGSAQHDNLTMWSAGEYSYIQSNGDEKGLWIKSNGEKVHLDDDTHVSGKLGVGIATPGARLQVGAPKADVWHIAGYSKTYVEAKAACVAQGGRLAYYSEVVDMYQSAGYHCSWGWIEEGFIVYPMHENASGGCGGPLAGVRVSHPSLSGDYGAYCARDTALVKGTLDVSGIITTKGILLGHGQNTDSMYLGLMEKGHVQDKVGLLLEGTGDVLFNTTGEVGIGTTSPSQKLDVSGYVKGTGLCIGSDCRTSWPDDVTGSGSTGYMAKWSGSGTLTYSPRLYDDGTGIKLGNFSNTDADQWPLVYWLREGSWDEGLIKGSSSHGAFGKGGFGIHMHSSKEWNFYSSGWDKLFAIEGGSGNAWHKGKVEIGGDNAKGRTNSTLKIASDGNGSGIKLYASSYFDDDQWGTRFWKDHHSSGISMRIDTQYLSTWHNSVVIGHGQLATDPKFGVYGGAVIGNGWAAVNSPPADGLLVKGNVGIGTTSPSSTLHVKGAIFSDGNDIVWRKSTGGAGSSATELVGFSAGGVHVHHDNVAASHTSSISSFVGGRTTGILTVENHGTGPALTVPKGNVGIGTFSPPSAAKLHVMGRINLHQSGSGPGKNLFTGVHDPDASGGRGQLIISSTYSDLVIASSQINNSHGSTLTFASYNPSNAGDYRKFVINQGGWGSRTHMLDFGYANGSHPNPHTMINSTETVLTLDGLNKRVGIGEINPGAKLHINGNLKVEDWVDVNGMKKLVTGTLAASGLTDRRYKILEVAVQSHHWQSTSGFFIELYHIRPYHGGYQKWYINAGYANVCYATLVELRGPNMGARVVVGAPYHNGTYYSGVTYPNNNFPIYVDTGSYSQWKAVVTTALPVVTSTPTGYNKIQFIKNPSAEDVPGEDFTGINENTYLITNQGKQFFTATDGIRAYQVCDENGANCKDLSAGWGTGTVGGSGSPNYLPKWTGGTTLGSSIMSESGSVVTIAGSLQSSLAASSGSTIKVSNNQIAIQQVSSEGNTRIFADFAPYHSYGIYHDNADNIIHFTRRDGSGLETWSEAGPGGTTTTVSVAQIDLDDGFAKFHSNVLVGTNSMANILNESARPGMIIRGLYPHLEIFSQGVVNSNHGPTIRLTGYDNGSSGAWKHWVIGAPGSQLTHLDFGYSHSGICSSANPHCGIGVDGNWNGKTVMRLTNNGYVGIGTISPSQKLDITGGVVANGLSLSHSNAYRGAIWPATYGDWNHAIYNNYSNLDGQGGWDGLKMNVYAGLNVRYGPSKISGIFLNDSGKVGLGTTSPAEKLHVIGTIRSDGTIGLSYQSITTSGNGDGNKAITAQDYSQWIWNTATNWGVFWGGNSGAAYTHWGGGDPNEIIFVGAGDPKVSLNLNNGNAFFKGNITSTGSVNNYVLVGHENMNNILMDHVGQHRPAVLIRGSYPHLELFSHVANGNHGPTIRFTGYDNGSSGAWKHWVIGTSGSQLNFLDIGYSYSGACSNNNPHCGISNHVTPTLMRIESNGEVGIGTTSPAYKLHVNGTTKVEGILYTNSYIHGNTDNAHGGGIRISDDGGFYDYNDAWITLTGSYGLKLNGTKITMGGSCEAPFTALSATICEDGYCNMVCKSAQQTGRNFADAQKNCFAKGGHICTESEIYVMARVHNTIPTGLGFGMGDWIGNNITDDNRYYLNINDTNNMEGHAHKHNVRGFACCYSTTNLD